MNLIPTALGFGQSTTLAKEAGIDDHHIMMLGRWRSSAYQRYIPTPPETLAQLHKTLAGELTTTKDCRIIGNSLVCMHLLFVS